MSKQWAFKGYQIRSNHTCKGYPIGPRSGTGLARFRGRKKGKLTPTGIQGRKGGASEVGKARSHAVMSRHIVMIGGKELGFRTIKDLKNTIKAIMPPPAPKVAKKKAYKPDKPKPACEDCAESNEVCTPCMVRRMKTGENSLGMKPEIN